MPCASRHTKKKYKMNLKIAEIYEHNIITVLSQTASTQVVTTDHDELKMLPKFAMRLLFSRALILQKSW